MIPPGPVARPSIESLGWNGSTPDVPRSVQRVNLLHFSATWIACLLVAAGPLQGGALAQDIEVQGITEAYLDATLSSPVAGTVARHFFKEGDQVEAGAVIMELDKRLEELEVVRR